MEKVTGLDILMFIEGLDEKQNEAIEDVIDFLWGDSIFDHIQESLKVVTVLPAEDRKTLFNFLKERYGQKTP